MDELKLVKLSPEYKKQLTEMMEEWRAYNLTHETNHSPWTIFRNDFYNFDYYLENLEHKKEENGRVPDSVFFLLDCKRNIFLGAVNIRHYLTEELANTGGHIGDGIRPSERRKGYGTIMVRLALEECKKLGIDKVLMTCDKDNEGSRKTITANGGVLENEIPQDNGVPLQRYWITL